MIAFFKKLFVKKWFLFQLCTTINDISKDLTGYKLPIKVLNYFKCPI